MPLHSSATCSLDLSAGRGRESSSPLLPCRSPPCSHHDCGPSSSPCVGCREGNKTEFTREIPECKQQFTTYPGKVSPTLSSSSSSSSSWQTNKQTKTNKKPTMTPRCLCSSLSGVSWGCPDPVLEQQGSPQCLHKTQSPPRHGTDKGCLQAVGRKMAPAENLRAQTHSHTSGETDHGSSRISSSQQSTKHGL